MKKKAKDWRGRHTDFLPCRVKSCLRERAEGTRPGPCPYHFGMWTMFSGLLRAGLKAELAGVGVVRTERQFWRWMQLLEEQVIAQWKKEDRNAEA